MRRTTRRWPYGASVPSVMQSQRLPLDLYAPAFLLFDKRADQTEEFLVFGAASPS